MCWYKMGLEPYPACESYLQEIVTKDPFMVKKIKAINLLELMHTDECGFVSHMIRRGKYLFKLFKDYLKQ